MYNGNTVSLKNVLWKVMRHPLATELLYEDAAEYAIDALELIGAPLMYEDKIADIKVNQYKAALPSNIVAVKGIRYINDNTLNYNYTAKALLYSSNVYIGNSPCEVKDFHCPTDYNYVLNNGVIKTSFEKGNIQIGYKCISTDEDGYPLIPDNVKVKLAIEYYILYRHLEPLYYMGKITDKAFYSIEQNKDWYIGGSQSSMKIANIDHAQATLNSINRLILDIDAHSEFFQYSNKKENIKHYN